MGRSTPTVGREKELGFLEATLAECIEEDASRAVLVTAPPGTGKSRLALEFLGRVRARGGVNVLLSRADPAAAGSSLALAQQLVAQAARVPAGATRAEQVRQLRRYARDRLPPDRCDVVGDFLLELLALSADDEPGPFVRAARNDPAVMYEQKRRAFEALLDVEASAGPVFVLLEDLHWGDAPTVKYVDEALLRHVERPFFVLALARPEVHERFPKLWNSASVQEIRLGGLPRKSAERLVCTVLGERTVPSSSDASSSAPEATRSTWRSSSAT
jgi:predicted ATPase